MLEFKVQVQHFCPSNLERSGRASGETAGLSVLAQERLATLGQPLPHWQDALARFIKRVTHLASAPN